MMMMMTPPIHTPSRAALPADTQKASAGKLGVQKTPPRLPLHGEVVRLDTAAGFGFIRTPEGEEYYFNHDSVVGMPFAHIQTDAKVQFIPEVGFEELHAKRVSLVKHGAS
jgi:cold shock CspA family protein